MLRRLIHIADSHFSEVEMAECVRLHDWIADDIVARKPDLIVHAGDVFDSKSTPAERRAVADFVVKLTELAPLLIVRGNHDVLGDLPLLGRLRTKHPVIVEEACGVHFLGGFAVGAVAWPRKAEILAALGRDVSIEEGSAAASEALRNVLRGMRHELLEAHDVPSVLVAHAMVRGSKTSTERQLVGLDMELGAEDLALAGADFVALGHIHLGQDWQVGDSPVVYPGSVFRTTHGEVEAKGYVVADFERWDNALTEPNARRWACTDWERIIVPATPMLLLEADWREGAFVSTSGEAREVAGAEIRYRYTVDADARDAARARSLELRDYLVANGAAHVQIEEVVRATTRARAPEVAQAKTVADKLVAMWMRREDTIARDDARKDRVLGRLPALEG